MADKVFNIDPVSGITSYWHYDEGTDTALIEKRQDVSGIIEANKAQFNEDHGRYGEWNKVASIPLAVFYDLKILETSATKIVFFLDGSVQESYIVTSNLEGTITNKFIINVIGEVKYEGYTNDIIENKESEVQTE